MSSSWEAFFNEPEEANINQFNKPISNTEDKIVELEIKVGQQQKLIEELYNLVKQNNATNN